MSSEIDITAIVGGTIIDGNGGAPVTGGVIVIDGKRIAAVGDRSMPVPPRAKIIDAIGKYVMPGMMDCNVHLFGALTPAAFLRYENRYEDVVADGAEAGLKCGLTTVFDTWGPREALTRVRDRINRGEIAGSRIFCAGNIIGLGGPASPDFSTLVRTALGEDEADAIDARWEQGVGPDLLWMTPKQVRERIRAYIGSGTQDFLKYAASGHGAEFSQFICFSADVQRAIAEEGHRAGMTVQAHTTTPESLRMEIEAGCDILQHPDLSFQAAIPDETLAVITERKLPCATLLNTRIFLDWLDAHGNKRMRTLYRTKHVNHRNLVDAGATMLLTTDALFIPASVDSSMLLGNFGEAQDTPFEWGEAHFVWLKAAFELGMKPMDVLMAATSNPARAYKVDKDIGTLEKGKFADLLVLDRNPLEAAANYRSISLVMKEGRIAAPQGGNER